MDLYASGDLPPVVAAFIAIQSAVMLLLAIVVGVLRGARRAQLASRAERGVGGEHHPLVEGKDVVLCGVVRHLEGHDVAVKVSVTQNGTETEISGSWTHSWIEVDREITVRPFLLELSSKELVRVDPPTNVDVADTLDQKVWIDRNRRVLSAELVPGEKIWVRGRLERSDIAVPGTAYRDVAWGWALGPTAGQMLLSSEPLGAGLRERARFHRHYAWIAVALLLAIQISLGWFYARTVAPTVVAEVAEKRTYQTTDSDGDTHDHYVITLARDTQLDHRTVRIDDDDYVHVGHGSHVPLRYAGSTNWNLGAEPTFAIWHGVGIVGLCSVFWIAYPMRRRSTRPWFRRKVHDSGIGRLPDP